MVFQRNMNEKVDTKFGEIQHIEIYEAEILRNFETHLSKALHLARQKPAIIREFSTNSRRLTAICRPKTAQTTRFGNETWPEKQAAAGNPAAAAEITPRRGD